MSVCVYIYVRMCVRARARRVYGVRVYVCAYALCMYVCACVRLCVLCVCVRVCVYACVCVC